jgi:hypothetical protein
MWRMDRWFLLLRFFRLQAPDAAQAGETVSLVVSPELGTTLVKADLSWNGRFLATITSPFAAVQAQVPAEALPGSRILVEAVGTDDQGETVLARVYGSGALTVEAYDDRKGLRILDGGTATLEDAATPEVQALDPKGRAALATALPTNWVKVSKPGYSTVWRSAGLVVGGVQAVADVRLTPLEASQISEGGPLRLHAAEGALILELPAGATASGASLSVTPLSNQGLPALLPSGWSAVSAWWIEAESLKAAGSASLVPPMASPELPAGRHLYLGPLGRSPASVDDAGPRALGHDPRGPAGPRARRLRPGAGGRHAHGASCPGPDPGSLPGCHLARGP